MIRKPVNTEYISIYRFFSVCYTAAGVSFKYAAFALIGVIIVP